MGKYIVSGEVMFRCDFEVEVDADSPEDARQAILSDPQFDDQEQGELCVYDWDVSGVETIESEEDAEVESDDLIYEDNGRYHH